MMNKSLREVFNKRVNFQKTINRLNEEGHALISFKEELLKNMGLKWEYGTMAQIFLLNTE